MQWKDKKAWSEILAVKMWPHALFRHKKDPFQQSEKSLETYIKLRFENCRAGRAPLRPYFLRSFTPFFYSFLSFYTDCFIAAFWKDNLKSRFYRTSMNFYIFCSHFGVIGVKRINCLFVKNHECTFSL